MRGCIKWWRHQQQGGKWGTLFFFGTNPNQYHQCVTNQLFTSHGERKGQCWELPVKRISSSHFFSFQKSSLFSQFCCCLKIWRDEGNTIPCKKKRVIWAISITTHDSKLTFFTRFVILRHSFSTVSSPFGWVVLLSSDTDHHFLLPPHPIPSHPVPQLQNRNRNFWCCEIYTRQTNVQFPFWESRFNAKQQNNNKKSHPFGPWISFRISFFSLLQLNKGMKKSTL